MTPRLQAAQQRARLLHADRGGGGVFGRGLGMGGRGVPRADTVFVGRNGREDWSVERLVGGGGVGESGGTRTQSHPEMLGMYGYSDSFSGIERGEVGIGKGGGGWEGGGGVAGPISIKMSLLALQNQLQVFASLSFSLYLPRFLFSPLFLFLPISLSLSHPSLSFCLSLVYRPPRLIITIHRQENQRRFMHTSQRPVYR